MGKNEKLINDPIFLNELSKYNLSPENVTEYEKYIVVRSGIGDLCVMFDKNYNTIAIETISEEATEDIIDNIYDSYNNYKYPSSSTSDIFSDYTLENFINLGSRIGHNGLNIELNGEVYEAIDESNDFINLLSYIKFISEEIQEYFLKDYQLEVLGYKMPYIYKYISAVMEQLDKSVEKCIFEENRRPLPSDLLAGLGRSCENKNTTKSDILYDISNLLIQKKGYTIADDYYKIEKLPEGTRKVNLNNLANNIVKVYGNVPKDVIDKRKQAISSGIKKAKKMELIKPKEENK